MSANWIKWIKGLVRRREVIAVANKLSTDRRVVACCCMMMWEWADDNTIDGHVEGVTAGDIDAEVGLNGFSLAVESVGWLRFHEGGVSIPRWDRHNGESAKSRALATERQSRKRHADVTPMSRSKRDKSVTSREQSRAEKKAVLTELQSAEAAVLKKLLGKLRLETSSLSDTAALVSVARELADSDSFFGSDEGVLSVVSSAEHVLHQMQLKRIDNPPGLFSAIVSEKRWKDISQLQEDQARERIKRHRASQNGATPAAAILAAALRSKAASSQP